MLSFSKDRSWAWAVFSGSAAGAMGAGSSTDWSAGVFLGKKPMIVDAQSSDAVEVGWTMAKKERCSKLNMRLQ